MKYRGMFTVVELGQIVLITKDIKNALIRVSESNCNFSFMRYYNQKGESFTWNKSKAKDIFGFIR